jgi:large subunit ribosomal protein L22
MEIKATQKFFRMSPRKLRLIVPLIKKMSPVEAFEKLPYVNKRAAGPLRKVIGTAIANAKQEGITVDRLIFKEIQIGEGPRLKRWRAGAKGRAKPYKKLMSHIRVVLTTKSQAPSNKSQTKSNDQLSKSKATRGSKMDKKKKTPKILKGLKTPKRKSRKKNK